MEFLWNPDGTLVEPSWNLTQRRPGPPRSLYLKAFSCWEKINLSKYILSGVYLIVDLATISIYSQIFLGVIFDLIDLGILTKFTRRLFGMFMLFIVFLGNMTIEVCWKVKEIRYI